MPSLRPPSCGPEASQFCRIAGAQYCRLPSPRIQQVVPTQFSSYPPCRNFPQVAEWGRNFDCARGGPTSRGLISPLMLSVPNALLRGTSCNASALAGHALVGGGGIHVALSECHVIGITCTVRSVVAKSGEDFLQGSLDLPQFRIRAGVASARAASSWEAAPAVAAAGLSVLTLVMGMKLGQSQALEVVGIEAAFNSAIRVKLTELEKAYKHFPFLTNCHVETIFAAFFRSLPKLTYRRECLRMADGGTVALDWPLQEVHNPNGAVLVLLPGLTGGSDDTYVQHLLRRACRQGWTVVVFNSRGCADSPVTTPQFYSASFTEDLRQVVKHVGNLFPSSRIYAAGWSLGANILVRYLGQEGERCPLSGAVSLCNPFDLVVADEDFHKGFNNIYDKSLARGLRKIFKKHAPLFKDIGGEYNIPKVAAAKSVRDFDDGLTRVSFGYKTVDDYYFDASSSRSIKDVKVPLLCIQALNDPIAPSRGIPRAEIEANQNCLLVVTPYGGHLGWVSGPEAPLGCPWTDPLVMQYLEALEDVGRDWPAFKKAQGQAGDVELVGVDTREAGRGSGSGGSSLMEP